MKNEVLDFSGKLNGIINSTNCDKHMARAGLPCFEVPRGVCGRRSREVYDGKPNEKSVRKTRYKKEARRK